MTGKIFVKSCGGLALFFGSVICSTAAECPRLLLPLTADWIFSTNNQDGVDWTAPGFVPEGWSNAAPALFYIESDPLSHPKNTALPERPGGGPMLTYYFRTAFQLPAASNVLALNFSALVDDAAVFYLNGVEVRRVGLTNPVIDYFTLSDRYVHNAVEPDEFNVTGAALTNLVTGTNVLAVEVHQHAPTSSDAVFGAAISVVEQVNILRGPYLQNGSATNVTVRWRTDVPTPSLVRFGTNAIDLDQTATSGLVTTNHEVRLTQLLPDTKYYYAFGSCPEALSGSALTYFVTAPELGTPKPTRIWVVGDAGTANIHQINVRNAYQAFNGTRHTDLWLTLGDNAYNFGYDAEYQVRLFDIYTNLLPNSVLWPALGNHDTAFSTAHVDTYPYFDIFTLPRNGEAGGVASGKEHYYSFDHGNIHFVCLDSVTSLRATNSPMYLWLASDLATNRADWTIAYWHHPPYSRGGHNSDIEFELLQMRRIFGPVLERGGVDLVLTGHSHSYERSFLLDRHYDFSTNISDCVILDAGSGREQETGAYRKATRGPAPHQGTVYVVAGSSGQASGGALNHPANFISLNNLGSLVLDVVSNRLDVRFVRETGAVADHFTILKGLAPTATNALSFIDVCHDVRGQSRITWSGLGGKRYRVSYRDGSAEGVYTDVVLPAVLEINPGAPGVPTPQSFLDDLTLTPPATAARFYRVREIP